MEEWPYYTETGNEKIDQEIYLRRPDLFYETQEIFLALKNFSGFHSVDLGW